MPRLTKIGDYEVQQGATVAGVVRYQGTHVVLPRRAVLEVLDVASTRAAAMRMMRHACILEALHHPGVPRVFECGMIDGRPWVAYERSAGLSFEAMLRARKIDITETLDIIEQVATILTHAHARGVLHRNITPSTIVRDLHRGHVVLEGWAEACTLDTELPPPLRGGTRYRAPELIEDRPAEGRADVFSLGVIAYQALTGRDPLLPLRAEDVPVEPPALAMLIAEMVSDVPALRPTAAEVVATLREIREQRSARMREDMRASSEYATFEVADEIVDTVLEQRTSDDDYVLLEQPRLKARWTPQWGVDSRTATGGVVEIQPRRRRTGHEDEQ